jgi:vanillate/4-hydroxybenzoate decarboxylase subunit D
MKCLRCLVGEVEIAAHAPDGSGAWEIYHCTRCNYSWRSSEPDSITDPAKRDPSFQLADVDVKELMATLPVAPLKAEPPWGIVVDPRGNQSKWETGPAA